MTKALYICVVFPDLSTSNIQIHYSSLPLPIVTNCPRFSGYGDDEIGVLVKQRSVDFLQFWIEGFYSIDFERNSKLLDLLEAFVLQLVIRRYVHFLLYVKTFKVGDICNHHEAL